MENKATYKKMEQALTDLLNDMDILSGNKMGPSDVAWQDVAGTAATNAQWLANMLYEARKGNHESFITFPCPEECLEQSRHFLV